MARQHSYVGEQRELARRLAQVRRAHRGKEEALTPSSPGERQRLTSEAMSRRRALADRLAVAGRRRLLLPDSRWLGIAASIVAMILVLGWNIHCFQSTHGPAGMGPDPERHRAVIVAAPTEAEPAVAYARDLLSACRRLGFDALAGKWADGIPAHHRDITAKSLAPFLAAPWVPLQVDEVRHRRDAVFVRCIVGEKPRLRLTLHLREVAPGRHAVVAIE